MEFLCRFNIVGNEKEFEGRLFLNSDLFRLEFTKTIPFNKNVEKEDGIEEIKYYSEYWDRYNGLFSKNSKIEGDIINSIPAANERMIDNVISGKRGFIIDSYKFGRSCNKQRVDYKFLFDSIIILTDTIDNFPGYYDNIDANEVLCSRTVSEISWNYDFEYQYNFFRNRNIEIEKKISQEINRIKKHSQQIFFNRLQGVYKISDDDFKFDTDIEEYNLDCFGKLNIDAWKLRKEQSNLGKLLPLECDVELLLKFDECISIGEAIKRAKCIIYFYNFILSDFNFPSQFRFLQKNNLFELKNNYNSTSNFINQTMNRFIIDVNIEKLMIEWVQKYDKYFKIPFELYKNSHNLNNSIERRFGNIITSLDSLFDRITPNELKDIEQADTWKEIKKSIKKCLPEKSLLLKRVHTWNRVSLNEKIRILSEDFIELYENKIEPEIRDSIPIRNWMYHGFMSSEFDNKFQIDEDFANFNITDDRLSLNRKIYILQKIFEFNLFVELGIEKEILIENINSDYIIEWINNHI